MSILLHKLVFNGVDDLTLEDQRIRNHAFGRLLLRASDLDYITLEDRFRLDFRKHGGRDWKAPYHHGGARAWVTADVAFDQRFTCGVNRWG